jgi:hypothetical protein
VLGISNVWEDEKYLSIALEKPQVKIPHGRAGCRWEDNIKTI